MPTLSPPDKITQDVFIITVPRGSDHFTMMLDEDTTYFLGKANAALEYLKSAGVSRVEDIIDMAWNFRAVAVFHCGKSLQIVNAGGRNILNHDNPLACNPLHQEERVVSYIEPRR